ncbi:hypothetical protein FOCC_FOCC006926 [Frankliniella occidentalis]|nr:hypothetical protein FOCC_FOCC006926 [Frankliniella occidentalis]
MVHACRRSRFVIFSLISHFTHIYCILRGSKGSPLHRERSVMVETWYSTIYGSHSEISNCSLKSLFRPCFGSGASQ